MNKNAAFLRLCLLCIVVLLAGCATTLRPSELFPTADPLLTQFEQRRAELTAISAEARVDQRGEQGRIRGTVLMFVQRGGRVRFDVMTQFGPVMTLTSDGARFALADKREHRFITGPTCAENIALLLRLPLTADQASQVLMGGVPLSALQSQEMEWDSEHGFYRIVRQLQDGSRQELRISIDPRDEKAPLAQQRLRLLAVYAYAPGGALSWEAHFSEHGYVRGRDGQQYEMPFEVHVLQPSSDTDTLIKFKEMTPNPDIPAGVFTQEAPGGMSVEEAPCE